MRELNIGSLGGLHYELYDLSPSRRRVTEILQHPVDAPAFLDLNGFFWSRLLSPEYLERLLKELADACAGWGEAPDVFQAAVQRPGAFLRRVREAEAGIFRQDQPERELFGHLETLAAVCRIYAFLHGGGFELTVQEGYLLDSHSSLRLARDCLVESRNPYLPFLKRHAWPVLLEYRPECVWLNGQLTLANMAAARFLRLRFPEVRLFWVSEGSEYYAANKITQYLRFNTPLFEALDGIVLFDCAETRRLLSACLEQGGDLETVPNLMYIDRRSGGGTEIRQTPYRRLGDPSAPVVTRRTADDTREEGWVSPAEVANVHLFPHQTCFWRKCSFCGINAKYPQPLCATSREALWPVEAALACLEELERTGIRYFWSIDEAIPAETLLALAEGLERRGSALKWQARSRFSPKLPEIAGRLAAGGLRELRLGLESASLRVLARMNKFGPEFSLALVESTVAAFEAAGVRVHCPMIAGFPGETAAERRRTYEFLAYLRGKYLGFSFNINIFAMDVGSPLFADWDSYDVSSVAFPCAPRYFLGNLVRWDCAEEPFHEEALREEQERVMRDLLYPWLPKDARISPHVLYRLLETTRSTLFRRPEARPEADPPLRLSAWAVPLEAPGGADGGLRKYYSLKTQSCLVLDRGLDAFFSFAASAVHSRRELLDALEAQDRITAGSAEGFLALLLESGILEPAVIDEEGDHA